MTIKLEKSFRQDFEKSLNEALRNHEEYMRPPKDSFSKEFHEFYTLVLENKRIWPFMFGQSLPGSRFDEDVNDLLWFQSWAVNCFLDNSYPKVLHYKREYDEHIFSDSDDEDSTSFRFATGEFIECDFDDLEYCESRFHFGHDDDKSTKEECILAVKKTINIFSIKDSVVDSDE